MTGLNKSAWASPGRRCEDQIKQPDWKAVRGVAWLVTLGIGQGLQFWDLMRTFVQAAAREER